MLRPFLFVGVGGSGGKVLAVARNQIQRRLTELNWEGSFPTAFQFLHFDVAAEPDTTKSRLPRLPDSCFHTFAPDSDLEYASFDGRLTAGRTSQPRNRALGTWRPDPETVGISPSDGAGMYRAIGRVIGLSGLGEVRDRVDVARTALTDTGPVELEELAERLGDDEGGAVPEPFVVVVSSVAGGSGSGIFLDVCDAIRSLGVGWADKSVAVLLAPDAFPRVDGIGLQGNALATVCELLSGYWNIGDAGPEEFELLRPAGVTPNQLRRRGARYNFMIGGSNGVVTFHDSDHVYEAIGTALSAWALNGNIQGRIRNTVFGNYEQSATREDNLPLRPAGSMQPFGAFGYARVDLGRRQFAEYAAERLARLAATSLLRGHLTGGDARRNVSPEEVIDDRVALIGGANFAHRLRLRELGEDYNEIIDEIFPRADDRDARIKRSAAAVVAEAGEGQRPASVWRSHLLERFETGYIARYLEEERGEALARARAWVVDIQHHILAEVADVLAAEGAPVTVALLEGLEDYLDTVVEDLAAEAAKCRGWGEGYGDEIVAKLLRDEDPEAMIGAESGLPYDAAEAGFECVGYTADAAVLELASVLAADLRAAFLIPLRRSIENAAADLRDEDAPSRGRGDSKVRSWPSGAEVPARFLPTATVILVEPADTYPERFSALLEESAGGGERGAERRAARAVTLGEPEDEYRALATVQVGAARSGESEAVTRRDPGNRGEVRPELIALRESWWPAVAELQRGSERSRAAEFRVHVSADQLLARAQRWVHDADHALGQAVAQSLQSFLDHTQSGFNRRRAEFNRAFSSALDRSRPLVDIDGATLAHVHGDTAPEYEVVMTPLGFDATSLVMADIRQAVTNHVADAADVALDVGEPTNDQVIEIFSFLKQPVEPVVIRSLMDPIAEAWTEATALSTPLESSEMELEFWNRRRARQLRHATAASPANFELLIRGWYVAHTLGQLDRDLLDGCSVWAPNKGRCHFPHPLLRPNKRTDLALTDLLAMVLESIPIALVDLANDHGAMLCYQRLVTLGQVHVGIHQASPIVTWLRSGVTEPGAPQPDPDLAGTAEGSFADRLDAVLSVLHANRERHQEVATAQKETTIDDLASLPLAADIATDVVVALGALERELRGLSPADDGGSGPDIHA